MENDFAARCRRETLVLLRRRHGVSGFLDLGSVLPQKALDPARAIDQFLLSCKKWMTTRADLQVDVAFVCGPGAE